MLNKFKKQMKNEKGLTLIELLAVIVILAIVAAIAIPAIGGIIQSSKEKAVIADAQNVLAAANIYFLENTDATSATTKKGDADLLIPKYLDDAGTLGESAVVTKGEDGESTIAFTGTAGEKSLTVSGKTKTDLNDKELLKEFE